MERKLVMLFLMQEKHETIVGESWIRNFNINVDRSRLFYPDIRERQTTQASQLPLSRFCYH